MRFLRLSVCVAACAAALLAMPRGSHAADVLDPDLGPTITNAVAFDSKLWVLGSAHDDKNKTSSLVSFGLSDGARQLQFSDVVAIAKSPGHLWVLRQTDTRDFVASEWQGGKFTNDNELSLPSGDLFMALALKGDTPVVVARHSVRVSTGKDWDSTKLRGPLVDDIAWGSATASFSKSGNLLYLGLNRGEYGGGLLRIDVSSGEITRLGSDEISKGGSGTVLSAKDTVTAIVTDAQSPDCVIAALGMLRPQSAGRLVRACGDTATVVLDKMSTIQQDGQNIDFNEAFLGAAATNDGFWAVSDGALYRFHQSGEPERISFPGASVWGSLRTNRDRTDMIVVVTDMNTTMMANGSTPIVVPLD